MRRHARRMRRYGMQPMVVINSGDPLPDLLIVTICPVAVAVPLRTRPARHRSPGRARRVAAARGQAALVARARGGAAAACSAPAWQARRLGLATRAERVYAAAVIAVSRRMAGRRDRARALARAAALASWLLSTCLLGVPWWAHRRRRARVRVERTLAAWPEIAQAVGLAGSRVMSAVVDVWGWRARFGLARGQTITDVIAKLPAIESGLGTFRGAARVYPTPDDLANRFELRVLDKDPHADAITWPGPSVASITEPIDLGPFEDAMPCHGAAAAPARPGRRRDRIGQERRPQRRSWAT